MKALVTGGAGFIGSHLCRGLLSRGHSVTAFDNLSSGKPSNLADLAGVPGFSFVLGDIVAKTRTSLQEAMHGCDCVFHLAAIPGVVISIRDPAHTNVVNVCGTLNVLEQARREGVRRFVYASSSSVYGDTITLPKSEDMQPDPLSPYATSKLAGEYYCQVYRRVYGLPTTVLRYFNVYGRNQTAISEYAAVVPRFIAALGVHKPVTIYGDGGQTRDFTFVDDIVKANILAAESDSCGVYNVSSGQQQSVLGLAELVSGILGTDLVVHYEPVRPGDIRDSWADISKAECEIGYKPEWDLCSGLRRTILGN